MIDEDIAKEEIKKFFSLTDEDMEDFEITREDYTTMRVEVAGIEIEIYDSYDSAEKYAIEMLVDDDYCWKLAVKDGRTTDGLYDWAKDVIKYDGLTSIAYYDGDWSEGKDYIYIQVG